MHRRAFLRGLTAVAAIPSLPGYPAARERPPWALGFAGVTQDLPPLAMQVRGTFPAACRGRLYRNGPALYVRGAQRYRHWFDPDGMVQAFRIGKDTVEHRGRFVRTRRFVQEERAGRFLYGGAGTDFAGSLPLRNNDSINVANINVQPLGGELLALWEAGSAYRIDPESLETLGLLEFDAELRGVPFSAHPHADEHGDLWNIGSAPFARRPTLVLYHLGADGTRKKSAAVPLDFPGYMHDFVLTPRYLIVLNSSAVQGEGTHFVDRMTWQPERASQLLVFAREDFALAAAIDVPATFVFHFGNAWEDGDETHFTACAYPDHAIVSVGMHRLAQQQYGPYYEAPELVRYSLSLAKGTARIESLRIDMEFPGFDRRRPFAAQALFGAAGQASCDARLPSAVVRVDPRSGARQRFDYGDGVIVEEPLYVPGAGGGWVLHSYLDYRRERSGVAVLRAQALADGPLATAEMERILPLGFHGCFLPATASAG